MSRVYILQVDQADQWLGVINRAFLCDFYHLPSYHQIAEEQGEGDAYLFAYEEDDYLIAFPLLLRPIEQVSGLEEAGKGLFDATSVYGYAGPVASHETLPPSFLMGFSHWLKRSLLEMQVVDVFTRLHPLLGNHRWLSDVGEVRGMGETVSIELVNDIDAQWAQYRKGHRYEIRRARREGLVSFRDVHWSAYEAFLSLYSDTMIRAGASKRYYFSRRYFDRLREALDGHIHLFAAEKDGEICSAALFVETKGIVQYHLSGSHAAYRNLAPSKLVLDEARIWANQIGAHCLHLGGGVGSHNDDLFRFKAGFSRKRHQFFVWNWIVNPSQYNDLVKPTVESSQGCGRSGDASAFFPLYRGGAIDDGFY